MWDLKIWPAYHSVYTHPDNGKRQIHLDEMIRVVNIAGNRGLQIGVFSGASDKYGSNWTSIDMYDKRPCIDYHIDICDIKTMAQFINIFDVIQCNAVLEHVCRPFDAASNLIRALKPGGMMYAEVPFVQPYHPNMTYQPDQGLLCNVDVNKITGEHGGDYWRFTPQGVVELFKPLSVTDIFLCDQGGVTYVGKKGGI